MKQKSTSKFSSFIKSLDIYGETFSFNINGKSNIKSYVGGLFSIITIVLTLMLIVYNFIIWITSQNPIVTLTSVYRDPSVKEIISLTDIEFAMGVTILETNSEPRDYKLLQDSIINNKKSLFPKLTGNVNVVGKMSPCPTYGNLNTELFKTNISKEELLKTLRDNERTLSDNGNLLSSKIYSRYKENASKFLCATYNNDAKNISIIADILSTAGLVDEFQSNTHIDLCSFEKQCNNSTALIQKTLDAKAKILFFYKDTYPDMQVTQGYSSSLVSEIIPIDYTVNYNIVLTVKKNIVITDNNILFNFLSNKNTEFYSYVINVWPKTKAENDRADVMKISIKYIMDKQINYFNRSYEKVDSLIANTYAIYGFIIISCQIIVGLIDIGKVDFYLMNKLYTYEILDSNGNIVSYSRNESKVKENVEKFIDKNQVNKVQEDPDKMVVLKENASRENVVNPKPIENKENLEKLKQNKEKLKKKRKHEFERKLCKLLTTTYLKCGKKSDFNKSMTIGTSLLEYDFNILTVMHKLIEHEKIMDILFTKDQKEMISFIKSRVITTDEKCLEEIRKEDYSFENIIEINEIERKNEFNSDNVFDTNKELNKRIIGLIKKK